MTDARPGGPYGDAKPTHGRIGEIQILRGLLALAVAIGHSILVVPLFERPILSSWDVALNRVGVYVFEAFTAVMLFFVISGFVLSESLLRNRGDYWPFVARRMLRLWPVGLCGVLLGMAYVAIMHPAPLPSASIWFNSLLTHDLQNASLWRNLLLIDWDFNGVLWSIHVEIGAAFLLPAIVKLRYRLGNLGQLALFVGLVALSYRDVPWIVKYLFAFYPGLYVRSHGDLVGRKLAMTALAGLVVTEMVQIAGHLSIESKALIDVLLGFVVVSYAVHKATFHHRALHWLGDISFSFYVVHLVFMHLVANLLLANLVLPALLANLLIAVTSCAISILCAWPLHLLVERPGIVLGRRFARARPVQMMMSPAFLKEPRDTSIGEAASGPPPH